MMARVLLAVVVTVLLPTVALGLTPTVPPPTPTPPDACTPRSDPLLFDLRIEPAQPQVGDAVRVTVGFGEVDGLLVGHALVSLRGAALLFGGDPESIREDGLHQAPVTFYLEAQLGGTAELSVEVNYETECACGTVCYYRRTVVSPPLVVSVSGPTATPTPQCTLPVCGDGDVFSCPGPCPGGCGTICATRTPTACPTPPCQNDETLFCPDVCEGSCGLTCATRTQTPIPIDLTTTPSASVTPTSNRPLATAKGKASPNPARAGETVQLLDDGSVGGVAGRFWTQQGEPHVELTGLASEPTFVAPSLAAPTTLVFRYEVCNFDSGCDADIVEVTVVPVCAGDCDGNRTVTINELLAAVNVALGRTAIASCSAGDADRDGFVHIADLIAAVHHALDGCSSPVPTPVSTRTAVGATTASPTATPTPPITPTATSTCTPTSCRAVIPVVAPVLSPTDQLEQTIVLCGIGYGTSRVNACGPAGCIEEYWVLSYEDCPLACPDSRQACVSGVIPLLPDQLNTLQVCQVPGVGCGPLPDLCAEEDLNGDPLVIEHRVR